jgi:hypothetical protein
MSVAQQAKCRRKAALVKRTHGVSYTERRAQLGNSTLGGNVNPFAGKLAKRSGLVNPR